MCFLVLSSFLFLSLSLSLILSHRQDIIDWVWILNSFCSLLCDLELCFLKHVAVFAMIQLQPFSLSPQLPLHLFSLLQPSMACFNFEPWGNLWDSSPFSSTEAKREAFQVRIGLLPKFCCNYFLVDCWDAHVPNTFLLNEVVVSVLISCIQISQLGFIQYRKRETSPSRRSVLHRRLISFTIFPLFVFFPFVVPIGCQTDACGGSNWSEVR